MAKNLTDAGDIWKAVAPLVVNLDPNAATIMACNTRYEEANKGILEAAEYMNAAVVIEASTREMFNTGLIGKKGEPLYAKEEWAGETYDGGLSGLGPTTFVETVDKYAGEILSGEKALVGVHGDHIQVKPGYREEDIKNIELFIKLLLDADCRSFGIDPSFFPVEENVEHLYRLAQPILVAGGTIEGEEGEIGGERATTIEEAVRYVKLVEEKFGYNPLTLLAINYETKHGEGVFIPKLMRGYQIMRATGLPLAGHGTSGTVDNCLECFPLFAAKANVGTNWDTVMYAAIPGLKDEYEKWAAKRTEELGLTEEGDKPVAKEYAHFAFREARRKFTPQDRQNLDQAIYDSAVHHMELFNMKNSADLVREHISNK